ncbi:MAG TPA: carboxypeptidase-like regulatory domain-containing protein [Terriglobales bacterium]|nr:carboxypeptidase-like regulatory domain-containing protein [Terriglobales bacterium]
MSKLRATILTLCIFVPTMIWAQSATTSLRGTILDSSGAVVSGATVSLDNKATGFHAENQADEKGQYLFLQLAPGTYTITAKATGLGKQVKVAELLVNQPATVAFDLSVQAVNETVDVSAETQTLNTSDATLGNSVNNATIEALPMEGRNVPDLLSLQPGVLYLRNTKQSADSRSGAVAGARSDQSNVTLDGIDDNDQLNGFAFTGVLRSTIDSVEEFRVTTTNANADVGRSSGAQVSMVTKSGTNGIHGSLYEYNRNTAAVANDWFNKQAEVSQGLPNVPGELIRNTFGVAVGGPIKKNKLFYFLNYEGQRTAESSQQTFTVPTASLRAGDVKYLDGGGNTVTLTPAQIATMDPQCTSNGTCPWGPGIDPNTQALFNQYPLPNGAVSGDGLNTASFTWSAPAPGALNTYIAKIDYIANTHRIFVRGNLQNDKTSSSAQFPGDPPSSSVLDNSKGIAVGDVWTIGNNLINSLHYGFIRQGVANRGAGQGGYNDFRGFSSLNAENRTNIVDIPVHNLAEDLTWVKHNHTIQVGANYRFITNRQQSDTTSWSSATGTWSALNLSGLANTGQSFDPAAFGFPAVGTSFATSYNNAIIADVGLVNFINTVDNYEVSKDGKTGNLLPQGSLVTRDFRSNEFEGYVQDSWRVKPNLTITYGLRYTLLQTPYELNGQQVQPTNSLYDWYKTRGEEALKGISDQPLMVFAPSGQERGLKPYWPMQKDNFAPRLAIAYSPSAEKGLGHILFGDKNSSSLRAGFGIYDDHFGQGIVNSFSQLGSFSLTTNFTNAYYDPNQSPRFVNIHDLPPNLGAPAPTTINYPQLPSTDTLGAGFQNTVAIDDKMKTPYSYAFNASYQRQLPKDFTLEVAYVGRMGRHLLQQYDLGATIDLVDPRSHTDYFSAATQLSKDGYAGMTTVAPIPYWENMFPDAAGGGNSATQNIYNLWKSLLGNETFSLFYLDIQCMPGCGGQPNRYWSPQYGSLFAWTSNGDSSYNAGQVTLRHPMSHGLQADFNYTYSKSLDLGSDALRTCIFCKGGVFSPVVSTWRPNDNRAVSDFDTTHILTADWVYSLPIGRSSKGFVKAVIGGWQITGLGRWTSGLPFGIVNSSNWATDWPQISWLVQTGSVKANTHIDSNGSPQAFADPNAITTGYFNGSPERNAYPGEAGQRNQFRGDGYFGIDSGLSKSWAVREGQEVKFAWEVFNVTNSVRFDVRSMNVDASSGGFGLYNSTLTTPRIQQFSLRYSF